MAFTLPLALLLCCWVGEAAAKTLTVSTAKMVGRSDKEVWVRIKGVLFCVSAVHVVLFSISPYGLPAVSGALSAPCTTHIGSVRLAAPQTYAESRALHTMVMDV